MTWIRFETTAPDHALWEPLGDAAGISAEAAFYHYFSTLAGLADHQPDGQVGACRDRLLETWARWRGKPGRWAHAFRAHCVEEDGTVRGWWRNAKLLERQERDRDRRRPTKNPQETRRVFRRKPAGFSAGNPQGFPQKTLRKPPGNPRATIRYGTTGETVPPEGGQSPDSERDESSPGMAPDPRLDRALHAVTEGLTGARNGREGA